MKVRTILLFALIAVTFLFYFIFAYNPSFLSSIPLNGVAGAGAAVVGFLVVFLAVFSSRFQRVNEMDKESRGVYYLLLLVIVALVGIAGLVYWLF